MMPTIVQKPKILDISETQLGTPRAIWNGGGGVQDALPHAPTVFGDTRHKDGGLEGVFIRCLTPNSVAQRMLDDLSRSRLHPGYGGTGRWVGLMVLDSIYLSEGILLDSQRLPSCVGVSHRQPPSRPFLLYVVPWTFGETTLRWGECSWCPAGRVIRNRGSCDRSRQLTRLLSRY